MVHEGEMVQEEYELPEPSRRGALVDDTASIIEKIDPTIVVERIKHKLLGEYFDNEKQEWKRIIISYEDKERTKPIYKKPFINREGVENICSAFESVVNANASMSNLKEVEINRILHNFGYSLADFLLFNCDEFDVDIEKVDVLFWMVVNNAAFTLKRAYNEGERRFLRTSVRSTETIKLGTQESEKAPRRRWRF